MSPENLQQTPLRAEHLQLGARLVPFAGWEMPVQYEGIVAEHQAVRQSAGMFDISHMGQFFLRGSKLLEVLDGVLSNRFSALAIGEGQYTFMLLENGGVLDDLFAYRLSEDEALLVVNASKIDEDWDWITSQVGDRLELENASANYVGLAVQGPEAIAKFESLTGLQAPERNFLLELKPEDPSGGYFCRTGYTGEDGFELFVPVGEGPSWWRKLLDAGVTPCGLGARDSLRLEACYPLNGNDLDPEHTPLEAGLGFAVKLAERDFPGAEALRQQKEQGLEQKLCALQVMGKGAPPRPGYPVMKGESQVASLSSGGFGPTVRKGIALAYLPKELAKIGTELELDVRGRRVSVEVLKKPFYSSLKK